MYDVYETWDYRQCKGKKPDETIRLTPDSGWKDFDKAYKFMSPGDEARFLRHDMIDPDPEYYFLFAALKLRYDVNLPKQKAEIWKAAKIYVIDIGNESGTPYIQIGGYLQ